MKLAARITGLVATVALAASPALAQMHSGAGHFGGGAARAGGGFHSAARVGGFGGRSGGTWSGGAWRGGTWHGGTWAGGRRWYGGWGGYGPGWGWGDPFFWGGVGFVAGYALAPDYGYPDYGYYDDGYGMPYGAPGDYAPAPPQGYDCDGWRWDPAQGRYVAAKVACQ
jgi:hypothetical protein